MKMVSQLTQQAMRRHRILSANAGVSPISPSIPESVSTQPVPTAESAPPLSAPAEAPAPGLLRPQPEPLNAGQRPRTIYRQLMSSHDRMTERHLPRT